MNPGAGQGRSTDSSIYAPSTVLGAFMDVAYPRIVSELLPEPMLACLGFPARSAATRLGFRLVRRTLWLANRAVTRRSTVLT